jgi:hypothetical protein
MPPPRRPDSGWPKGVIIAVSIVAFVVLGSCAVCSAVIGQAGQSFDNAIMNAVEERQEEEAAAAEVKRRCRDGAATPLEAVAADDQPWAGRCLKVSGVAQHVGPKARAPKVRIRSSTAADRWLECNTWTLNTDRPAHDQSVEVVGVVTGIYGNPIQLESCEWTAPALNR